MPHTKVHLSANLHLSLVTFISDYGYRDAHVAIVKAALWKLVPTATVLDGSHGIAAYDIMEAAVILRQLIYNTPEGTFHLVGLENGHDEKPPSFIAACWNGHYILTADHGLISLLGNVGTLESVSLKHDTTSFGTIHTLVPALAALLGGTPLSTLGPSVKPVRMLGREPHLTPEGISGSVMYIDQFGNLYTNITKSFLDLHASNRTCRVQVGRHILPHFHQHYGEVDEGELLAYFAHDNFLCVAIHGGKASSLLGMRVDSPVRVLLS